MKRYLMYSLCVGFGILLISWLSALSGYDRGNPSIDLKIFLTPRAELRDCAQSKDTSTLKKIRSQLIGSNKPGSIKKL